MDLSKRSDQGYLAHRRYNWWFDPEHPNAFELFDLDGFYSNHYYGADHVNALVVEVIVVALRAAGRGLSGREVRSVLDLGCGQGQFSTSLLDAGLEVMAVEGSKAGVARAIQRGVPPDRIRRHDLRLPLRLDRKFDVVMCTEVAEHIETPFSGQLINTIAEHTDLCWFSSEPPSTNESHLHYPNEQPDEFWMRLFQFYGFQPLEISLGLRLHSTEEAERYCREEALLRGRFMFVRTEDDLSGRGARIFVSIDDAGTLSAELLTE